MGENHNSSPSSGVRPKMGAEEWRVLLKNPLVMRGGIAMVGGVFIILLAERQGPLFRWAVAVALVFFAVSRALEWRRTAVEKRRTLSTAVTVAAAILVAFVFAAQWFIGAFLVELAIMIGIGATGISDIVASIRTRRSNGATEDWSWSLVKGVFLLIFATLVALWPANMVFVAVAVTGFVWAFGGAIALVYAFKGKGEQLEALSPSELVMDWLQNREFTAEERMELVKKVSFEGPDHRRRLIRFSALMVFSVIIAALGVMQDSTAVVIGAMLVAPLMTPIMGLTASIVMGWPRRGLSAGLTVLAAVVGAIAVAAIVSDIAPVVGDVVSNSQVLSRTSPTILDLMIALAAGATGAFALSRQDVSDSLPGVAIAVALVPPLAVVGITLAAGDYEQSLGALLLFLTNFVSIVLAGAATFIVVGVSPFYRLKQQVAGIRVALGTFVIGAALIIVPLAWTTHSLSMAAAVEAMTDEAIEEWMGEDSEYSVSKIQYANDTIDVTIRVSGGLPPVEELGDSLAEEIPGSFTLRVSWTPETVVEYESDK